MKISKKCVVVIAGLASMECITPLVGADSAGLSNRIFACSLGKKSVSVTAVGKQLTYKFGTPTNTEISIIGSAGEKNVLYREDRYAGMEHQLRFVNGRYSYVVYNMEGNRMTGVSPISGLIIKDGTKTIGYMACVHYSEFSIGFDYTSILEDTEDYSAM